LLLDAALDVADLSHRTTGKIRPHFGLGSRVIEALKFGSDLGKVLHPGVEPCQLLFDLGDDAALLFPRRNGKC
jgi:hypothetical protein